MTSFHAADQQLEICFSGRVVRQLQKYRQTHGRAEAGGLLFADKPNSDRVVITFASLPSRWDTCLMSSFRIDVNTARKNILKQFQLGKHYVGEWHTHAQARPQPSAIDKKTITDLYRQSEHELNYLVLMVLGSSSDFSNSYVALADGANLYQCSPI